MKLLCEAKEQLIEKQITLEIMSAFDKHKKHLIPALQQIQEKLGYISQEAMEIVASHLGIQAVEVYEVVTFYNQFRLAPPGKNQIKVCMGTACHMKGGHIIMDAWERKLGIKAGETTEDRQYSLERVACIGCCNLAPVMVFNEEIIGKTTPTKVEGLMFSEQVNEAPSSKGDTYEQKQNNK